MKQMGMELQDISNVQNFKVKKRKRNSEVLACIEGSEQVDTEKKKHKHKKFKHERQERLVFEDTCMIKKKKSSKKKKKKKITEARNSFEESSCKKKENHEMLHCASDFEDEVRHKKRKKAKKQKETFSINPSSNTLFDIKKEKKKKKKKNKGKLLCSDGCEVVQKENEQKHIDGEVTGFIVDALSEVMFAKSKKKHKKNCFVEKDRVDVDGNGEAMCNDTDNRLNASELLCDLKDTDKEINLTPSHTARKSHKLKNLSDINLLNNPENSHGEFSDGLDCSQTSMLDLSVGSQQQECLLPLTQNNPSILLETSMSSLLLPYEEEDHQILPSGSLSWHIPEQMETLGPASKKVLIKSLCKEVVNEVLPSLPGVISERDENVEYSELFEKKSSDKTNLKPHRRSIVNYENFCRSDFDSSAVGYKDKLNNVYNPSPSIKKQTTIRDLYRMPKRKKVPTVLYETCRFILEQEIPVSPLNIAYRGFSVPSELSDRDYLRRKFGARNCYHEEQDQLILRRFETLVENGIVVDKKEFCEFLNQYCSGKDRKEFLKTKSRTIGVRNIVGLYVGQDIPNKMAWCHCQRLLKLILGKSYVFSHPRPTKKVCARVADSASGTEVLEAVVDTSGTQQNNEPNTVQRSTRKRVQKWSLDEDQTLMDMVICHDNKTVEEVVVMEVDWEAISEEFVGRTSKQIKEHWLRTLQPALVEETEPEDILQYRKRLLEDVRDSGAKNKLDIVWSNIAPKFYPKSRDSVVHNFGDLMKQGWISQKPESSEEFHRNLSEALAKVVRMLELPDSELRKKFKRNSYKANVRHYYSSLVDKIAKCTAYELATDDSN